MKLLKVYDVLRRGRVYCLIFDEETERNKRIPYHLYIWIINNGPIPKGCHIHHIDGNKLNNDISNLQCMTKGEHSALHTKQKWLDPEFKEKMRQVSKNRIRTDEEKDKIRNKLVGHRVSDESKQKMSDKAKLRLTEEYKEKLSNKTKQMWSDPEYVKKQELAKEKRRQKLKENWAKRKQKPE